MRSKGDRSGHTPCCSPSPETFLGHPFSSSKPASCWVKTLAKGRARAQCLEAERKQSRLQSQAVPCPGPASGPSKPCL